MVTLGTAKAVFEVHSAVQDEYSSHDWDEELEFWFKEVWV